MDTCQPLYLRTTYLGRHLWLPRLKTDVFDPLFKEILDALSLEQGRVRVAMDLLVLALHKKERKKKHGKGACKSREAIVRRRKKRLAKTNLTARPTRDR